VTHKVVFFLVGVNENETKYHAFKGIVHSSIGNKHQLLMEKIMLQEKKCSALPPPTLSPSSFSSLRFEI
jgi:hypothetical protein